MGFRAVCREECVSSMHRRGEPIDYRMVEDAQEDVRLFLAAFRALPPEGSSIFSTYLGAYRRGRVLLSRQKLRALSGKYVAALDDALEVLKRESRADFCEVAGDMYRMCNLPADASRLYALSASKSRPSNQLRFKQAATCASAGKFRDAWLVFVLTPLQKLLSSHFKPHAQPPLLSIGTYTKTSNAASSAATLPRTSPPGWTTFTNSSPTRTRTSLRLCQSRKHYQRLLRIYTRGLMEVGRRWGSRWW